MLTKVIDAYKSSEFFDSGLFLSKIPFSENLNTKLAFKNSGVII